MKTFKSLLSLAIILIVVSFLIFLSSCGSQALNREELTNPVEVWLEESDRLDEKFQALDEKSEALILEYMALDEKLEITKEARSREKIFKRQESIKLEIEEIIRSIEELKLKQVEIQNNIESYTEK